MNVKNVRTMPLRIPNEDSTGVAQVSPRCADLRSYLIALRDKLKLNNGAIAALHSSVASCPCGSGELTDKPEREPLIEVAAECLRIVEESLNQLESIRSVIG
jgi:hypothetical protein